MNYDLEITRLVAAIKDDKTLVQPFKNYAMSDAQRLQAVIRMAKTTANITPPAGTSSTASQCICSIGVRDTRCPVHGSQQ